MRPENLHVEHIARIMKLTPAEVLDLAENPRQAFAPPKRKQVGGKARLLTKMKWTHPGEWTWKMRYQWLGTFVRRELPSHPAAHGGVPGRSPFTAGERHLGTRHLLGRDVRNAFPSVTASRFYLEMLAIGLDRDMASLLTKLLLPDGYIPQGGPASNAAIDLFFSRIDADIEIELSVLHTRYTRFTDNLDSSFRKAQHASAVAEILERNLARIGLSINTQKAETQGWQPVGTERVMCGVCVNSSKGTQLPRQIIKALIQRCESLHRGARSVSPHSIVGLAGRRRALQGWVNQASQAAIAPTTDLQRRLRHVDALVLSKLMKCGVRPQREWYTMGTDFNEANDIAARWRRRRTALHYVEDLALVSKAC
jgi:hypothetical protein